MENLTEHLHPHDVRLLISSIDARWRPTICFRMLGYTLSECASALGVSQERVRQKEMQIYKRMATMLQLDRKSSMRTTPDNGGRLSARRKANGLTRLMKWQKIYDHYLQVYLDAIQGMKIAKAKIAEIENCP